MTLSNPATPYDVAILGGGPAGLSAALALGRARRRVLLCDGGPRRNAAATHLHNFVTRDGIPPSEFRDIARDQLAPYSSVEVQDLQVESIAGQEDEFLLTTTAGQREARRVLLCTGMIDEGVDLPGFHEAWGTSIFQCPYCHGWEVRDRRWGYLALTAEGLHVGFPALLRNWSDDVILFSPGGRESLGVEDALLHSLERHGVRVEPRPVSRLVAEAGSLTHVELADGDRIACEVLFAHPPQRQVDVVQRLGVALDEAGYVQADPMSRQTSVPGVYAAGDLTTRAQGAVFAAAAGTHAAGMINHDLSWTP